VQNNKHACVPPDILSAILHIFEGVTDLASLGAPELRKVMKLEGWGRYYKYTPQILYHLKGEGPPPLHPTMERNVLNRFAKLQRPFEELVKPRFKRKNFLCYTYVTRQCLFLEGAPLLLQESYSVSKDPTRLFKLDRMWKVMCDSLHWRFRPLSAKGIKAFPVCFQQ
jgi:hypothetical protein